MPKTEPAPAFESGPELGLQATIRRLTQCFEQANLESAHTDARLLALAAAGLAHDALLREPERAIGRAAAVRLEEFANRRLQREPVSRILGRREFWSLELEVTPDVLDPRPDTETIVEAALATIGDKRAEPLRILDLGVGSGALLCALLRECPRAQGFGIDVSAAACRVAQRNLDRCGLSDRGQVLEGDWTRTPGGVFDLVVSNPPYIVSADIAELDPEVREYDPLIALDGGADGLCAFRALAALIPERLAPDGSAVLEFGMGQSFAVRRLLEEAGLKVLRLWPDLSGLDRAIACRLG